MIFLGDYASTHFVNLSKLKEAFSDEICVVNLEGAVLKENTDTLCRKSVVFNTEKSALSLRNLNTKLVTMANNHSFDLGNRVADCRAYFGAMGITVAGAGSDISEANMPCYLSDHGQDYVIFSFCWSVTGGKMASAHRAGVASIEKENIEACIRRAKKEKPGAKIVLLMHWGIELEKYPEPMHVALARHAIDCGADLIIGHHPHCIQPIEKYKGKYIFYSIGNFYIEEGIYFAGRLDYPPASHGSLAVQLSGDEMTIHCLRIGKNSVMYDGKLCIEQAEEKYSCPPLYDGNYPAWFKEHRVKKRLIPIYYSPEAIVANQCKNLFLKFRGVAINLLMLLHLKNGRVGHE